MTDKIATIRGWIDESGLDITLEVDGGIDTATISRAARAGADVFVAGTAIFAAQNRDYAGAIEGLRQAARS